MSETVRVLSDAYLAASSPMYPLFILGYTLDLSFCYVTCAAVVVIVYWPGNPRHELIYTTGHDAARVLSDAYLAASSPFIVYTTKPPIYPSTTRTCILVIEQKCGDELDAG